MLTKINWHCLTCSVDGESTFLPTRCPDCLSDHDDTHGPHATRYRWALEISVAAEWVADGIDLSSERQLERLTTRAYPHTRCDEVIARVVSEPDTDLVAREQGYRSAAHRTQCKP